MKEKGVCQLQCNAIANCTMCLTTKHSESFGRYHKI